MIKASEEVILREIAGEYILVPVGSAAQRLHGMITVSESGCQLWNRLCGGCERCELAEVLLDEYEIDRETAEADAAEFVGRLEELGLVSEI